MPRAPMRARTSRMTRMRYRTKLTLMFVGGVLLSNAMLFALLYTRSRDLLMAEARSKVMSIAATTAAMLDGEQHKHIQTRDDEKTPAFAELEDKLRRARNANRRSDVHIKYLYTLTKAPEDPNVVLFGVDPEESLQDKSHVGDVYKATTDTGQRDILDETRAESEMLTDQWGSWLSATAPVRDAHGNPVAAVGADLSATEAIENVTDLHHQGAWFLVISGAFAVMMAM